MSEELLQKDLINNPDRIGKWNFYNIGSTTIKQLKENGIIQNINYGKEENKKVDALIVYEKNVIAVVEYKKSSEFNTEAKRRKAIKQELEVARKLNANILVATDKQEGVWINVLTGNEIKDDNEKIIRYAFDFRDQKLPELIEKIIISISEQNDQIKSPRLVNPTGLAKQIWQDIWSVSGATPENCLYTFVELFIFKYLSDLAVLQEPENFNFLLSLYEKKDSDFVLEYYAKNIRTKIKDLFPENKVDKTTIINGTIFVSKDQKAVSGYSTVFKKVLFKFQDYGELEHIAYDFKSQLFESFLKESISKKNWGQFFTPLKVVRAIVEMTKDEIKEGVSICDPACGVGKFLLEPIKTKLEQLYRIEGNDIRPKITIHGFDKGFDKDEQKTIILAKANMLIYFSDLIKESPSLTEKFAKLFNDSFTLKTNSILGTLAAPIKEEYDLILTNPPYVTSGSSNLKDEIRKDGELEVYYKVNAMGVEGLFMEWIIRALKPGGKAFIVAPDGIFNRQNDAKLRKFILDECYLDAIISLPLNTFFTTNKKTYILALSKKDNKSRLQTAPVFTYLVSEIGETRDIYRFEIEQDDLSKSVIWFKQFKGAKEHFNTTDKRCKVQPIGKFLPEEHWSVDRWWTREEKIELGIEEEDSVITTEQFSDLIRDISETLVEFSEITKEVSLKKKSVAEYKEISLNDVQYFELSIGKRILKKDLINLKGDIPVYSANVLQPVGYSSESNIKNLDNNFVLWGIDGDFTFSAIHKNEPFATTDHCGAIRIFNDNILPEYLMIQLETVKHQYGFDRGLRASLRNMSKIALQMPIDESGSFNVEKQNEIIEKYKLVQEIKNKIADYRERIDEVTVSIERGLERKRKFQIKELFDIERGKGKYTKTHGNLNKGIYPVYSASNKQALTFIDTYDFDGSYLTWAANGFAGYMKIITGKFSINADRGLLKLIQDNIDITFIKKALEPKLREMASGRKGEKGKDEFTKVYPSMLENVEIFVPVDEAGDIDLEKQKEIAKYYKKIEEIKTIVNQELERIERVKISFE